MSEKLRWILKKDFLEKSLWAPYHINRDIDYYDDLSKKYRVLYDNAKTAGADKGSLEIIKKTQISLRRLFADIMKAKYLHHIQ